MIKKEVCPECGSDTRPNGPPNSAMGEHMQGRGLDRYCCDNPRCNRFGR